MPATLTAKDIIDNARLRRNRRTRGNGLLTRTDVMDFLKLLPEDADRKAEFEKFIDSIDFLRPEEKKFIKGDFYSYDN